VNSFQRRKYFQGFANSIQAVIRDFIATLKGQGWHFWIFIYLVMLISTLFKHLRVFRLSEIAWSPPVVKGLFLFIYMWNLWRKGIYIVLMIQSFEHQRKKARKIFFRAAYTEKRRIFCIVFEGLSALASFLKSSPFRPNEFLSSSY